MRLQRSMIGATLVTIAALVAAIVTGARISADGRRPGELTFRNPSGVHRTITTAGVMDDDNPFFQELGTNGRTCLTCHRPAQGWSITPAELRTRFDRTNGLDSIFRSNDGS